MPVPQGNNPRIFRLEGRCLIKVSGDDAETFLQGLVTHDVMQLGPGQLAYSALLTPQGRFLHDFFILSEAGGFFLECERQRREDLIRRLNVFKLRAKVKIEDCREQFDVYASGSVPEGVRAFEDPRLKTLGYRFYLPENGMPAAVESAVAYRDMRIGLGVPEGSPEIKPETDVLADVNIDQLNAVSWDKGCYVGQEVTARMNYRGIAKKRMMIVSGHALTAGDVLTQSGHAVGEIRAVNSSRTEGLAILKLAALEAPLEPIIAPAGDIIVARLPDWLKIKNT